MTSKTAATQQMIQMPEPASSAMLVTDENRTQQEISDTKSSQKLV